MCIYTLELKLVELPFPLADRGRTRMGEEDNDHESDDDIVFRMLGLGGIWATTEENCIFSISCTIILSVIAILTV